MDHWLNKRPFDRPDKAGPKKLGRVIVIGAGPAGLAAAQHLQVKLRLDSIVVFSTPHAALHGRLWSLMVTALTKNSLYLDDQESLCKGMHISTKWADSTTVNGSFQMFSACCSC